MHSSRDEREKALRFHLEHCTQRFTTAAAQRMQAVNFFLATASLLCYAAVSVPHTHLKLRLILIIATFTVTVLFYLIEVRSKSLVDSAERAMEECLQVLRRDHYVNLDDSRLIVRTDEGILRYGKIINLIYGIAAAAEVFAFGYFFCLALNVTCPSPSKVTDAPGTASSASTGQEQSGHCVCRDGNVAILSH